MKYALVTFGCRVNQADSLAIEGELLARGASASAPEDADLVVVNTCSVTASADQAARQTVRRLARLNPSAKVVVTGCYATRRPDEVSALPNVARVVSNEQKESLVEAVAASAVTSAERFAGHEGPCGAALEPGVSGRTALTLRVQTGCDETCSYCIIPSTRGRSRSRSIPDILRDVDQALAAGYKEIALTGVHLGSYGRDLNERTTLATLLRALGSIRQDSLFRVSSLEPMDCTDEIVELMASSRFAPHFHLPLQHGSDEMLRAMRRPYTAAFYRGLIAGIKKALPHVAIGSDLIVGFPGETDVHFDEMRRLLEELPLTHLHVFPYSDRPGTEASRLDSKVDGRVIRQRAAEIRAIGEQMSKRFRASQVGRTMRALTVDDGQSVVTGNYLKLRLPEPRLRNEWIHVRVGESLSAEIVDKPGTPTG